MSGNCGQWTKDTQVHRQSPPLAQVFREAEDRMFARKEEELLVQGQTVPLMDFHGFIFSNIHVEVG